MLSVTCDRCGRTGPANVGCVFLDGVDVTGWEQRKTGPGIGRAVQAIDLCPDCKEEPE